MASLVGAITLLSLAGVSGMPPGDFTKAEAPTFSRPNDGQFTRLGLTGTPTQQYGDFTGKTFTNVNDFVLSDSIRCYVNEGTFSQIDFELTEVLPARVTDFTGAISQGRSGLDTLRPRVTDTVQFLQKSGTLPKVGSDPVRVFVAESASTSVRITGSENVRVYVADAVSGLEKPDAINVSDTILVVLDDDSNAEASNADRAFSVTEDVVPALVESARVTLSGEVDSIDITAVPFGSIRITEI